MRRSNASVTRADPTVLRSILRAVLAGLVLVSGIGTSLLGLPRHLVLHRAATPKLFDQVRAFLAEYAVYLPLTVRQI
jgi:hypothetical protein